MSSMIVPLLIIMMVVPTKPSDLTILDTPDGGTHPASCALTCSGIGRWDATGDYRWRDSGAYPGKGYKYVGISGCNFVSPPVVIATTRSASLSAMDCPSVIANGIAKTLFYLYTIEDSTAADMKSKKCDVHWSAFGYNC